MGIMGSIDKCEVCVAFGIVPTMRRQGIVKNVKHKVEPS